MLYGMCINGFEAWTFQNACCCHRNRKETQFNTKVNNNLLRLRNFKMATVAMEIIFEFIASIIFTKATNILWCMTNIFCI